MKLPVSLVAEYRGLDRQSGSFEQEGVRIEYGRAHRFEFEQPDGTVDTIALAEKAVDEAADFDVAKLGKGDFVHIEGVAGAGDRGLYVRPVSIRKASKPALAAAS